MSDEGQELLCLAASMDLDVPLDIPVRGAVRSPKWQKLRNAHLAANPQCIACGDVKNHEKQVHHVVPVHVDPTKELDPTNLVTLCGDRCHIIFGHCYDYHLTNPHVVEDCARMLARRIDAKMVGGPNDMIYLEGTDVG